MDPEQENKEGSGEKPAGDAGDAGGAGGDGGEKAEGEQPAEEAAGAEEAVEAPKEGGEEGAEAEGGGEGEKVGKKGGEEEGEVGEGGEEGEEEGGGEEGEEEGGEEPPKGGEEHKGDVGPHEDEKGEGEKGGKGAEEEEDYGKEGDEEADEEASEGEESDEAEAEEGGGGKKKKKKGKSAEGAAKGALKKVFGVATEGAAKGALKEVFAVATEGDTKDEGTRAVEDILMNILRRSTGEEDEEWGEGDEEEEGDEHRQCMYKKKHKVRLEGDESSASFASDEEFEEEEEEEFKFDRQEALAKYSELLAEKALLVKKNLLLQMRLLEYCKMRKMEVYFEEVEEPDPRLQSKYHRQLWAFDEFVNKDAELRAQRDAELQRLSLQQQEAEKALASALDALTRAEREVGTGLVLSETGKPVAEKVVERLLSRQQKLILQLYDVRLRFIKLRNDLANKEEAIRRIEMETFGEGMHLLDYEQLRMENQSYSDKIEERDEELTRLRAKATSAIQILAHIREKANATSGNIEELYESLEGIDKEVSELREYISDLKKNREALRLHYRQLRQEAGLLVHKQLLKDFERAIKRNKHLSTDIAVLRFTHHSEDKRLTSIKSSIKDYQKGLPVHRSAARGPYDLYKSLLSQKREMKMTLLGKPPPIKTTSATPPPPSRVSHQERGPRHPSIQGIKKGRPDIFARTGSAWY